MLLHTSTSEPVISSGLGASSDYGISVNGKAFRILSDTLYQNKIGSCVREISSNASDSHIAVGKASEPFHIHLPDAFEPWFSVRDFGLGMDDASVRKTFATLFLSTKDNSNDQVGAFGLGSKTPFAYTDSFTITSIFNGIRRCYSAMMDDSGMPTVTEMSSNETDESNGVEIIIGVDAKDYSTFAAEVADQLKFFKVKPIIKNYSNFNWPNVYDNIVTVIDNVSIYRECGKSFIVQGGVGYPLNLSLLKMTGSLLKFAYSLINQGAIFEFPIGEIEVNPSRENISYNIRTIHNIVKAIANVQIKLNEKIMFDLAQLNTNWERANYMNDNQLACTITDRAMIKSLYKFEIISNSSYFNCNFIARDMNVVNPDGSTEIISRSYFDVDQYTINKRRSSFTKKKNSLHVNSLIPAHANVVVIIDDKCIAGAARITNYMKQNPKAHVLVISRTDNVIMTEQDIIDVKAAIGEYDNIMMLSEIERPARAIYNSTSNVRNAQPKLWRLENIRADRTSELEPIFDSIKSISGGYYLISEYGHINGLNYHHISAFNKMNEDGLIDKDIFVLRSSDRVKIKDNPEWIYLNKFIADESELMMNELSNKDLIKSAISNIMADYKTMKFDSFVYNLPFNQINDRELVKFLNKTKSGRNCDKFIHAMINSNTDARYDKIYQKLKKIFNDRFIKLNNKYMMLDMLDMLKYRTLTTEYIEHLIGYVNHVHAVDIQ